MDRPFRKLPGYTHEASAQMAGERVPTRPNGVSPDPTPYIVHCRTHGGQFLTTEEYTRQMMAANYLWTCPLCGATAHFDDEHYKTSLDEGDNNVEA